MSNTMFSTLWDQIQKGKTGENGSIPFGLERIDNYLDISKSTSYVIGAESGTGKSSITIDQFLSYPIEYYLKNKDSMNLQLDVLCFSMERKFFMSTARLVSKWIYEDHGILIPVKKILGRTTTPISEGEEKLISSYKDRMDLLEKHLFIKEGVTPYDEMYKFIHDFAKKHGEMKNGVYHPHHPNHIVLIIIDHIGLVGEDKYDIDKFSKLMRQSRDVYGFSPVEVMQLNREISSVQRSNARNRPKLSDLSGTSNVAHDADVVIALFDPYRHITLNDLSSDKETKDCCGYVLENLVGEYGYKYYRSLHILKNTYDGEGISVGLGFHPFTGIFKTLPKADEMTAYDYEQVISGKFFTDAKSTLF